MSDDEGAAVDGAADAGATGADGGGSGSGGDDGDTYECCVCLEDVPNTELSILRGCKHSFCRTCISAVAAANSDATCPLCRGPFEMVDVIPREVLVATVQSREANDPNGLDGSDGSNRPNGSEAASVPAKVGALLEMLTNQPTDDQAVVFSQFTSFLDVIAAHLAGAGISYIMLTGAQSVKKRTEVIAKFTGANGNAGGGAERPTVLLASLKVGGQGLNLVNANHVYITDVWWNSAGENKDAQCENWHQFSVANCTYALVLHLQGLICEGEEHWTQHFSCF